MKSCKEMRREAWRALSGKWFWRLLVVGFVLQGIAGFVNGLVSSAFAALSIHSFGEFLTKKAEALQTGIDYTLPSLRAYGWMLGGFAFQAFIVYYVFGAIVAYGIMRTLLKAHADDETGWFSEAFGGFARPFEVTGLLFLMNLKVFLWFLLFFFPGLVAVYRYRLAWFLKNEHVDWSASKCLAESGRLMKGVKWKAFCLDLSYFGWWLLACATLGLAIGLTGMATAAASGVVWGVAGFLTGVFAFYLLVKVALGFAVSRAVFYRELVPGSDA